MSAEQWLENGDCKQCRRAKYCSKVCKAHRIATQRMIRNMVLERTGAGIIANALRKGLK